MPIPDAPMPEEGLRVSPSAGLSEVATPDAYGANVGEAAAQAGEIQTRLYHDANSSAVMRAHNEVDAAAQEQLYSRDNGLLYKNLGENAPPAVDKAASDYTAKVSDVRGSLTNQAQKDMFDKSMGEHGLAFRRTLSEYEHKQVTAGQNAQTQAYIANRQTDIAQNFDKPDIVAQNIAQQRYALVQAYARNTGGDPIATQKAVDNGTAPDALKEILSRNTSAAHMTALNTMLANGQNGMGAAYFEAHKQDLDAKDLDQATRMVRIGTDSDKARDTADTIIAKTHADAVDETGVEDKSKESLEVALNTLESAGIKDTRVYDQAKSRLVNHFNLMKSAHREQQGDLLEQATTAIDTEGNTNYDIPANLLGQMDFRTRQAAEGYQAKLRKFGSVQTDDDTRLMLSTMAREPEQWDAFAGLNVNEYKDRLNKVDFRKLQDTQAYVKGQIERRDTRLTQGMVSSKITNELFIQNGLQLPKPPKPGDKPSADYTAAAKRQTVFLDQLNRAVQADALQKKRELNDEEILGHARRLFAQQAWQRPATSEWDAATHGSASRIFHRINSGPLPSVTDSGPAFEAPGASRKAYSIKDVPEDEVHRQVEAARKAGLRPSDKDIIDAYNEKTVTEAVRGARGP